MKLRRRHPCFVDFDDRLFPDKEALANGEWRLITVPQAHLLCPFTGIPLWVAPEELRLLAVISHQTWVDADAFAREQGTSVSVLESLVKRQILVGDGAESAALRRWEEDWATVGWHPAATIFHAQTRWTSQSGDHSESKDDLKEQLRTHAQRFGPPPPEVVRRPDALARVPLPPPVPLKQPWTTRRTTRTFRTAEDLPLEHLSQLLSGVYGFQDTEDVAGELRFLKKTSPSGGGLHPIEAYPFVAKVAGLEPGLYHYSVADHVLELLCGMTEAQVREHITRGTAGQRYFGDSHAAVLQVARFDRAYWKYRQHPKLYKTLMMDAAHLSQSWYLMAAERSLGAWFTAAINDGELDSLLALDPLREAALAFHGLGVPDWTSAANLFGTSPS